MERLESCAAVSETQSLPRTPAQPQLRLVLAVSLDGRLAPPEGGAAQIGGRGDRRVLEEALAWADAALLGAETLRRHGCSCLIHAPDLLQTRRSEGRPDQPLALVASRGGAIPANLPFFSQPLERWLLLAPAVSHTGPDEAQAQTAAHLGSPAAAQPASGSPPLTPAEGFARVLPLRAWQAALQQLAAAGVRRLVVLGGASLAASLLADNCIDELQLTLCPQLLGGAHSWLGPGAALPAACRRGWRLLEQRPLEGEELLLRYGRALRGD